MPRRHHRRPLPPEGGRHRVQEGGRGRSHRFHRARAHRAGRRRRVRRPLLRRRRRRPGESVMSGARDPRIDLVPRLRRQGYSASDVAERRAWVEARTGVRLPVVGSYTIPSDRMRGNIENPIGAVQMPLGVAGPLEIHGSEARGVFYVPLATTEGALVRSYERGMITLTRSGGVTARIVRDENTIAPVFVLDGVAAAVEFADRVAQDFDRIKRDAESTTRHGK